MDLGTWIGALTGVSLIAGAIALDGDFSGFLNVPGLLITLGGTFAAMLIHFRPDQVLSVAALIRNVLKKPPYQPSLQIRHLIRFAERARREGLLALEEEAESLEDPFLKKGLQLVVDGTDPELVKSMLETELAFQRERHEAGQELFETLARLSPAFGMLGTLIGLIQMLRNLENPEAVGPGLAVALLTTFYGLLMAYLIFIPIAGKLRVSSQEEALLREMAIEGLLSIQAGDNPRTVEEKLWAFLPPKARWRDGDRAVGRDEELRGQEEVSV